MARKHEECIFTDVPQMVCLPSHVSPVPFWVSPDMGEGLEFGIAAVDVSKIIGSYLTDGHSHDCAEIYMAPSPNRGDMVFEIALDDEVYTVESPMVVFVPAGVKHKFKALKAEREGSYFYGILLNMKQA